jgi:hypothetical protein
LYIGWPNIVACHKSANRLKKFRRAEGIQMHNSLHGEKETYIFYTLALGRFGSISLISFTLRSFVSVTFALSCFVCVIIISLALGAFGSIGLDAIRSSTFYLFTLRFFAV